MSENRSVLDTLHEATHRVPGVPDHVDQLVGHHGDPHHGLSAHASAARERSSKRAARHSSARHPRVLVAWQRRVAAFFGQKV